MKIKAFSILELIVSMAIIAVLVSLSFIAIQTIQRSQRNTERRAAVNAIKNEIEAYYGDFGIYPESLTMQNNLTSPRSTMVTIGEDPNVRTLTLKSNAQIAMKNNLRLPYTIDAISGAVYCYEVTEDGYSLAVYLEGENTGTSTPGGQYGNSSTNCPAGIVIRSSNAN